MLKTGVVVFLLLFPIFAFGEVIQIQSMGAGPGIEVNGNIIMNGAGGLIRFPDGTEQATAAATGPGGLVWRGAWNSSTTYAINDAVSYNGSSYIAIQAGANRLPLTQTMYWNYLASKGDAGGFGYSNIAVVATSGGDYNNPATAMSDYATWCGTPRSANNPCLLKIMPGSYDVGTTAVIMQPYIDIEGSGENVTVITGTVGGAFIGSTALVIGDAHCEIRFVTLDNKGGGSYVNAIVPQTSTSLAYVTAKASGGTNTNTGIYNASDARLSHVTAEGTGGTTAQGIYNFGSTSAMTDVSATASGGATYNYGLRNSSSSPDMNGVRAEANGTGSSTNYGIHNAFSSPNMMSVTAKASATVTGRSYGVYNSSSNPNMRSVIATAIGGTNSRGIYNTSSSPQISNSTASASAGTAENQGIYNLNSSPSMTNVSASATSAGSFCYGVYNENSSPVMAGMTITASGCSGPNGGVYNYSSSSTKSSPIISNSIITASGGMESYGIINDDAIPSISDVSAVAQNATENYGLYNNPAGPYTLFIDRSSFEGSTNSIRNGAGYTLRIGATKLNGAANALGTYTCFAVYDGSSYAALTPTCQP